MGGGLSFVWVWDDRELSVGCVFQIFGNSEFIEVVSMGYRDVTKIKKEVMSISCFVWVWVVGGGMCEHLGCSSIGGFAKLCVSCVITFNHMAFLGWRVGWGWF